MKLLTLLATLLTATATTSADPLHVDLEVDPTAYVLSGYSVHVGLGWKRARLDLGTYAMDVPELLHGNAGWDTSFVGAGAKLQWFPFAEQRGAFVDAGVGVMRQRVELRDTGTSSRDTAVGVGVEAGWRFSLPHHFYVTPWAGLNYAPSASDVMLDGRTFQKSALIPFAAVHVGYRFR